MNFFKKAARTILCSINPQYKFLKDYEAGKFDDLSDEEYLKKRYSAFYHNKKELNLDNPVSLCEKLNWLKLYNRKPEYTKMVDKFQVKEFVSNTIGEQYITPTFGVWDSFDEIDFDSLPNQFVLKVTHDSGGLVICKDKATFNKDKARTIIEKALQTDFYKGSREWPYKNVKHRVLAEKYIDGLGKKDSLEYKVTCCDGKVKFITICRGIPHTDLSKRTNNHFDKDFNELKFWTFYKRSKVRFRKPNEWNELIDICEKLSKGIPYVRIDTYIKEGRIIFGEMTFFTWGGFMRFHPKKWDLILGNMVTLPEKYKGE